MLNKPKIWVKLENECFLGDWMYFVAFAAIVVGLVIFSRYVILQFLMVDILFCRLLLFAVGDSVETFSTYGTVGL